MSVRSSVMRHRLFGLNEKRIDIRWRDLDALGHVNQAVYQTYGEEIVDAWFREVLELAEGEVWDYVVVRLATDYRSELRLRDKQVVGTARVVRLGNSSVTVALDLRAASDGRVAEIHVQDGQSVEAGALLGFGKKELYLEATQERLSNVLGT